MDELIKKFSIIHRLSGVRMDRQLRSLGISHGQVSFIMCLCENEGVSQEWLSAELRIDKGVVARVMRRLEGAGFVRRCVASRDRRQYQVFPTEKAKKIFRTVREMDAEQEQTLTRDFSKEEKRQLVRLLDKVIENLG